MPEATAAKPRILFVEDEVTVRDHLAQKLSDEYLVVFVVFGFVVFLSVLCVFLALVD